MSQTSKRKKTITAIATLVGVGTIIVLGFQKLEQWANAPKYKEGPLGMKHNVSLSRAFTDPPRKFFYDVQSFRENWKTINGWDSKPENVRQYIDRAITNYEYGYTFGDGDSLLDALESAWSYGASVANSNYPIQWPLPKA